MSWNASAFCGGLEGMIRNAAMSAAGRRSAAPIDESGPEAIAMLAAALRRERRISAALSARLETMAAEATALAERAEQAEAALLIIRHRR